MPTEFCLSACRGFSPALFFCLGLILVVLGGAELFTGNTLMVMALASGKVRLGEMLRAWAIVHLGNLVGAVGMAGPGFPGGTIPLRRTGRGKSRAWTCGGQRSTYRSIRPCFLASCATCSCVLLYGCRWAHARRPTRCSRCHSPSQLSWSLASSTPSRTCIHSLGLLIKHAGPATLSVAARHGPAGPPPNPLGPRSWPASRR